VTRYGDLGSVTAALARALLDAGAVVAPVVDSRSPGSSFGAGRPGTLEIIGSSFVLTDPSAVLIRRPGRLINTPYLLGNLLWTIAGSDRLEDISYYNSRATLFSPDGIHIEGAWGPRLFGSPLTAGNQFATAVERLRRDPSTRRAVMSLLTADEIARNSLDLSCAATVQYMLREGKLHAVTVMRSQSLFGVLPYDVFLFTCMQGIAAAELDVPVGNYLHIATSLHVYEDELPLVRLISTQGVECLKLPTLPNLTTMKRLSFAESLFRKAANKGKANEIEEILAQLENEQAGELERIVVAKLAAYAFERCGMLERAAEVAKQAGVLSAHEE
jgi:thymidylate synthase